MKQEFIKYLQAIGIPNALYDKIERICEFCLEICRDEIRDIFITDYIKEDGEREYQNLWLFSQKYCMEAKQFNTKDDFDITPIQNRIRYWTIQKQDYDFKKATEKSRLYLRFNLDSLISADFKAAKENCDYLRDIILTYVVPNLKE